MAGFVVGGATRTAVHGHDLRGGGYRYDLLLPWGWYKEIMAIGGQYCVYLLTAGAGTNLDDALAGAGRT
nr:hypothetical protein [Pseudomonas sp. BIGb0427]